MHQWRLYAGRLFAGRLYHRGAVITQPVESPETYPSAYRAPPKPTRHRHPARCGVLLEMRCQVQSTAGLRLGANAAVNGQITLKSTAGLRIGAAAKTALSPSLTATADVHDIVLEMLLIDA